MTNEKEPWVPETPRNDLSNDEGAFASPDWHMAVLAETEKAANEGRASFRDWEEAKSRILEMAARLSGNEMA
jgi:hypothetical protein